MMKLDCIKIKKATKKIGGGEGQSTFDQMQKKKDFIKIFLRKGLTERKTPLNNILTEEGVFRVDKFFPIFTINSNL
jgi:hypothetical protein